MIDRTLPFLLSQPPPLFSQSRLAFALKTRNPFSLQFSDFQNPSNGLILPFYMTPNYGKKNKTKIDLLMPIITFHKLLWIVFPTPLAAHFL